MTIKQHIDPRTSIGRATLRYRGLPTRHLLSMLGMVIHPNVLTTVETS